MWKNTSDVKWDNLDPSLLNLSKFSSADNRNLYHNFLVIRTWFDIWIRKNISFHKKTFVIAFIQLFYMQDIICKRRKHAEIVTHWFESLNPLSNNLRKWPNALKQFGGNSGRICLSAFDHFMELVLKRLRMT